MKRTAFTMIELIFVIVILGILAAVAIPRFSATRSDAEVSKIAMSIMTSAGEISSYATSQARVESDLSKMSNAIAQMKDNGDATLSPYTAKIKMGNVNDCVTVKIETDGDVDILKVEFGDAGGDDMCQALQGAINANDYPMKLRGTSVEY